ncbi:MAG: hypothetical protein HZC43_10130 [Nitrosomonadales bacterium]|nr:hypothetical protein [Nitrosomonadales bacterium]
MCTGTVGSQTLKLPPASACASAAPDSTMLAVRVPDFRKVAGAASFAAAREDLKSHPAAHVIPLSDSAGPNVLLGAAMEQKVSERFGVILAAGNARDARGDAVNAALEALRGATIESLLGFVPADGYDPVQYGGGRLLLLDVSIIWWQLEFTTGYWQRKLL